MTEALSVEQAAITQGFRKPSLLGVGTIIWLGSELMFFSGLFAAYFTIRAHHGSPWPPTGDKLDLIQSAAFTLVLVASSFTCQKALWDAEHGQRRAARWWLVVTIVMGAAFVANQGYEWNSVPFSSATDAFGSMFYVMTGLHGLHVILGLVALMAFLGRMAGPSGDPGELDAFQAVSYYWHFVDIVWIFLYSSLFLLH
ncbi:MAG: aa3-type cytochrome oxidase subunit III [Acidimicrobiales bacterium]